MKQATFTRKGYESAGYTSVKRWKQFLQTFCMECLYMQIFMQNCLFQKTSRRFKQNAEAFKAKRRNVFLKRRGLFSTKWRLWRKRIVMHHPAFFHSAQALSIFLFSIAQLFQTTFQLYLQLFQGTFRNKQKQKFRNRPFGNSGFGTSVSYSYYFFNSTMRVGVRIRHGWQCVEYKFWI